MILRHHDLEAGPFSRLTGLGDGDTGDREDLAGEEEAEAGMFPVAPLEEMLLVPARNADPVVLAGNHESPDRFTEDMRMVIIAPPPYFRALSIRL